MMTWTHSIRHPWFTQPSTKRKQSPADNYDDDSSSSDASTPALSPRRRKRVKYSSLERRLAHMSLGVPVIPGDPFSAPTLPEDGDISSPKAFYELSALHLPPAQNHLNVILPSSVEEPSSPPSDSEPVDMDIEPELVTSGIAPAGNPSHTAGNWDGTESGQLDVKEVQISSAVLERLREQTRRPLLPLPSRTSQALMLYRPPQLPSPKVREDVCDDQPDREESELHPRTAPLVAFEEDAMDVE